MSPPSPKGELLKLPLWGWGAIHPRMHNPDHPLTGQRLLLISLFFAVLLNYPMLSIFSKKQQWAGIPVLYLYIFVVWVLLIVTIGVLVERIFGKSVKNEDD